MLDVAWYLKFQSIGKDNDDGAMMIAKIEGCDDRQMKIATLHVEGERCITKKYLPQGQRLRHVVGGEDDLHSLLHMWHASIFAYISSQSLSSLLAHWNVVCCLRAKLSPIHIIT